MRALLAALIIAVLAVPSYAQATNGKKRHGSEQKTDTRKNKPDDRAYKSALDRLPNQKYDPWQGIR